MRHEQFLLSQNFPFVSAVCTELEKVGHLTIYYDSPQISVTTKIFVSCKDIKLFKYTYTFLY